MRRFLTGIDVALNKIINVATGTAPNDAVNLAQLQSAQLGNSWHGAVRAASTTNVTVSSPGAALDGVTLAAGNRVLLKNQSTASENGPYIWNGASSALTRSADGQTNTLNAGAAFYVDEGTTNADTAWTLATDDPITVGSTALVFNKFGAGIAYSADGTTINLSGTTFSVNTSKIPIKISTNLGDGSSTTITISHNIGTRDIIVAVYDTSTFETIECDEVRTDANTLKLTFGTAPASGAYRAVIHG